MSNKLTPWRRVLHKKLIVAQLVKTFPVFCRTGRFIIVFTKAPLCIFFRGSTVLEGPWPPHRYKVSWARTPWTSVPPVARPPHTQDNTTQKDADKHPSLERDLKPRSQHQSAKTHASDRTATVTGLSCIVRTNKWRRLCWIWHIVWLEKQEFRVNNCMGHSNVDVKWRSVFTITLWIPYTINKLCGSELVWTVLEPILIAC
jgi:hypothetical protein